MPKIQKTNNLPARRFDLEDGQIVTYFRDRKAVLADRTAFATDSGDDVAERERILRELVRRANAYHERRFLRRFDAPAFGQSGSAMKAEKTKRRAGRPSLSGETGERYQVTIPPTIAERYRAYGDKSLSAGIIKLAKKLPK